MFLTHKDITPNEALDENAIFKEHYTKLGRQSTAHAHPTTVTSSDTYNIIPAFYTALPKNADSIGQKLREEARTVFLQKRSRELLDNNELKVLWTLVESNYTVPTINGEKFISYDDYGTLRDLAGPKSRWMTRESVIY